jgi:hypothetical protein
MIIITRFSDHCQFPIAHNDRHWAAKTIGALLDLFGGCGVLEGFCWISHSRRPSERYNI